MQHMEWDGRALHMGHQGPQSRAPMGREHRAPRPHGGTTRTLPQAGQPCGERGTATHLAPSCRVDTPLVGGAERRDARTIHLLLRSPCVLSHTFPQLPASSPLPHACHYQPSLLVPLTAPLSHAPFCPLSTRRNKDSRPLVVRHHPAGSKVIEVGHDNAIGAHEVVLLAPSVRPTQPTELALVLLRHPH